MSSKTPKEVKEILKKLSAADQVAVQTYIARLKQTITDLEESQGVKGEGDDDDGHAHYHGHQKCTHDHGHDNDHGKEVSDEHSHEHKEKHGHSHEHSSHCKHEDHESHDEHSHGHSHGKHEDHSQKHSHESCDHKHDDGHSHEKHEEHASHGHEHSHQDVPEWKKKAMNADPNAAPFGGSWNAESSVNATENLPPLYEGSGANDDFDKAADFKMKASEFKSSGEYQKALEKYSEAVVAAAPSALLYANRADVLLKLSKPKFAIRDCDEALKLNPDSAKALRIRGLAKKSMELFEDALKDLSQAQAIDYDDSVAEHLKICTQKHMEAERDRGEKRQQEAERMKKKAEEIKKAREEAAASQSRSAPSPGGMPGGMPNMAGMPGGMGGLGGLMSGLMSDPELAAGMQNPKVMKAFSDLMSGPGGPMGIMSNPAKLQELMADEDVGPFLRKLMAKVGPMMGAGAGGMPGMPGMNMPSASDDDIPDIPDVGDDMPNLD